MFVIKSRRKSLTSTSSILLLAFRRVTPKTRPSYRYRMEISALGLDRAANNMIVDCLECVRTQPCLTPFEKGKVWHGDINHHPRHHVVVKRFGVAVHFWWASWIRWFTSIPQIGSRGSESAPDISRVIGEQRIPRPLFPSFFKIHINSPSGGWFRKTQAMISPARLKSDMPLLL